MKRRCCSPIARSRAVLAGVCLLLAGVLVAVSRPASETFDNGFPRSFVSLAADARNPLFQGAGPGHWDAVIRERGWILREGNAWHLWYTGYDGTRDGIKRLGYATSRDGITWIRYGVAPLIDDLWVEDMTVVKHAGTYYMFAEGTGDRTQLLTSTDRIHWQSRGTLDVRQADGSPIAPGPFGTPTVLLENGIWHLFYEREDAGIWLATSRDLQVWTNVRDEPLLVPGPEEHDRYMIALNQIVKYHGVYYANYHGTAAPRSAWNTNLARSTDLIHWQKYPGNPVVRDRSSGQMVHDGQRWRLYTTHHRVDLFWPQSK